MQEVQEKMLIDTKNNLASRLLLSKEFTKRENSPFETVEPNKNFDCNQWTIRSWELMDYTREEIKEMCQEYVIQVIIPEKRKNEKSTNNRNNGYLYILRQGKIPDKKDKRKTSYV